MNILTETVAEGSGMPVARRANECVASPIISLFSV